ncbi:MAG TPA: hypothetical protein VLW53_09650, partial [Candidatus Eisenbacteria bacterium]|nr:hypothetical protein [Candidatus Eisenbacteria bacterium]
MTSVTGAEPTVRATDGAVAPRPTPRGVAQVMDLASDAALLSFAVWTVLYHGGLLLGISVTPLLVVWLVTVPLAVGFAWRWLPPDRAERTAAPRLRRRHALLLLASLALAGTATALVAFERSRWTAITAATAASALVLLALVAVTARFPLGPAASGARTVAVGRRRLRLDLSSWAVLAMGVALPSASLFFLRADGDDVYYVNRAVWVADHGTLATRD